jgi:hypothetical protein
VGVSARLYFRLFPLVLRPVFFIGLFLRYFNDLSCIWRAPTPCKSPVFFNGFFSRARSHLAHIVNQGEPNMRFQPGQSGNPAGRPRGSRNKRTVIVEKLLDDSAGQLTTVAIARATDGDPAALRACMDRVAPRLRHRPLDFDLPDLVTLADTPGAIAAIAQGLSHGELDREEAIALMRAVREFTQALAAVERDRRAASPAAHVDDGDAGGGESLADFLAARTR